MGDSEGGLPAQSRPPARPPIHSHTCVDAALAVKDDVAAWGVGVGGWVGGVGGWGEQSSLLRPTTSSSSSSDSSSVHRGAASHAVSPLPTPPLHPPSTTHLAHPLLRSQITNWFLASAPGHPALENAIQHVVESAATKFHNVAARDTVDRTGPGAFTDAVLKAAFDHPPSKVRRVGCVCEGGRGAGPWGIH